MSQDRDTVATTPRHPVPSVEDMTNTSLSPRLRWSALAVLAIVGTTTLSGCTLRFTEPGAPPPTSPEQSSPSDEGSGDSPDSDDPGVGTTGGREDYIARANQTIPCSPGLDVAAHGAIIRVEGACDDLTVSADAAVVVADDVRALTVTGDGSTVLVLELTSLQVSGDVNLISWTGATPSVSDTGTANTLGKELR